MRTEPRFSWRSLRVLPLFVKKSDLETDIRAAQKRLDKSQDIVRILPIDQYIVLDFFKETVVMNFTWTMIANLVIMVLRALLKAEPPKNGELDDPKVGD